MNQQQEFAQDLLNFIDQSPSPWHAVSTTVERLIQNGFEQLFEEESWGSLSQGNFFVVRDQSSIIAFSIGNKTPNNSGFNIIGAHSDSPGLRVKPNPVIRNKEWLRLGVEVYGGPILATFADRDLSLAGRVAVKTGKNADSVETQLLNFEKPMLRISNLPIHLNRGVNENGLLLNRQTEIPPLLALTDQPANYSEADYLKQIIADAMGTPKNHILGWELAVYDTQKGQLWGTESEFLSNSQLDNLASCHAALTALQEQCTEPHDATQVIAFFDHEEIGSESQKGADGCFLGDILSRIGLSQGLTPEQQYQAFSKSTLLSADMAHAWHPAFPQKFDQQHRPVINAGPVLKINYNQRYTTQAPSEGLFVQLCEQNDIPYQKFINRTDLSCGSTIGPMTASKLGIESFDVGAPMFSMHSIRESAGVKDHFDMLRLMSVFLSK